MKVTAAHLTGLWYHGDRNKTNFFNRKFDVEDYTRDRNAVGPGIYFTRIKWYANGYAEPDGYVYTVKVNLKPSRVLTDTTPADLAKVRAFVEGCEDDDLLANYGQPRRKAVENAVKLNAESGDLLSAVIGVYNDLYQRDSAKFAEMMVKIGYDALLHQPNPEHAPEVFNLVVYEPKVIEIVDEERYTKQLEHLHTFAQYSSRL